MAKKNRNEKIELDMDIRNKVAEEAKVKMLMSICVMLTIIFGLFVAINFYIKDYFVAVVNATGLVVMAVCGGALRISKNKEKVLPVMLVFGVMVTTLWILTGGTQGFGILWIMIVPPFAFYILKLRGAVILCFILWVELVVFMWTPLHTMIYEYDETLRMRFPILYLAQLMGMFLIKRQIDKAEYQGDAMLQLAIRYRDEAEEASRAKSDFLSNVSHEIRTPLNAIIGMDEMILRESDDEKMTGYALMIRDASNALLTMINDILDISKIEAGRVELVTINYDISSLISDCYNMIYARTEKKGLELTFHCDENFPKTMRGDMVRVRQIVMNLLTNAVKYTHEGSVSVDISGECLQDIVLMKIVVTDTGIGMKQEHVDQLFDKFQRFELRRNQAIEGTGLGMCITKELVDLMKGDVVVESEYGKGSVFTVMIPQKIVDASPIGVIDLNIQKETGKNRGYKHKLAAPGVKILFVDDVNINLQVAVNLLKGTEIEVDTVLSGKQCLDYVRQKQYDLIFMDHMMPEMDGIETLKAMQQLEEHKNKNTPVIMLTANALEGEREKYLAEGFHDYLTKPINIELLEQMIVRYAGIEESSSAELCPEGPLEVSEESDHMEDSWTGFTEAVSGFDMVTALRYCGDDKEFLREMLQEFAVSDYSKKLKEFLALEDWESYKIKVHALKGVALSFGLKDLSETAKSLEMAAKNGDVAYILQHNAEVTDKYEHVAEMVRRYL